MILVDAHVHIYDCFVLQSFLESALHNFKVQAARCNTGDNFTGILLLTESAKDNWFQRLVVYGLEERSVGPWTFHHTKEACSLKAQRENGERYFLIAGRQIVSAEDLEVLALLTDKQFHDGQPITETIQAVKASGAIPVIPWGFGKWMGVRGRILRNTLARVDNSELFIGDNRGRPGFLRRPSYFRLAESGGIKILPGSDPLPFASEFRRPGSFGFWIEKSIISEYPANEIRDILLDPNTCPRAYGDLENPFHFFHNQARMQFRKQMRKRFRVN